MPRLMAATRATLGLIANRAATIEMMMTEDVPIVRQELSTAINVPTLEVMLLMIVLLLRETWTE